MVVARILVIFCSLTAVSALAVDKSHLWLPRSDYRYFKDLYRAAQVAEDTERCRYVIAGTLSRQRSTEDHPIFKITCRDPSRQTFAWIVDGNSLKILNLPPPPDPEEVAKRRREKRLTTFWSRCKQTLDRRLEHMRGVSWLTKARPEPVKETRAEVAFEAEFDAFSSTGERLHYRGQCHFTEAKPHGRVAIHPRLEPIEPMAVENDEDGKDESSS